MTPIPRRPPAARAANLGQTGFPRRRRQGDPMRDYDALPAALRGWLAGAALPWSPASCRRIWARHRAEGIAAVLERLDRAERAMLSRERLSRGR
ncbi:DUF6525 family protein [Mangrovicoccus algicola]|uniref:Uncharacterized protein n=1 Tax=Mangrovicoccus algicola TaxID=2771008 RepID=A0A8J7CIF6_9RHOB|nr:DUF6525 family protein [Mangrovicoccus algicola]MBE3639495.1 hypothetical protein [Mangrovicoccus algicola]